MSNKDKKPNNNLPPSRSLTRSERQRFRNQDLDPAFSSETDSAERAKLSENMINFIVDEVYGGKDGRYDDVPWVDLQMLAQETYRKTYGGADVQKDESVKNS